MATQVLKMLCVGSSDLSDEAYDSIENDTRAALVNLFVRQECELAVSQSAVENNDAAEDRFLYLGSHQCRDRAVEEPDSIYIELWAWIDEDGNDFVTWNISTADKGSQHPILFCPFCGCELAQFLAEYVSDESTDD